MDMALVILMTLITLFCGLTEGKMVDLTHDLNDNDTLVWPGFNRFQLTPLVQGFFELANGERAWFEYNEFSSAEHLGTHMDAPCHVTNSDKYWKVHQIPVERFIGDAVVIDITERAKVDPDASLLVSDLEKWEEENGQIQDGSIVLMNSGWDQYWGNETAFFGNDQKDTQNFHFPGISVEASNWLIKNRVISGVGVDTISIDNGNNLYLETHRMILSENIYGLENVKNLGRLPAAGARIYVFPMKIKNGSGGPTRIIAEFEHLDATEVMSQSKAGGLVVPFTGWLFAIMIMYHLCITVILC